MPQKRSFQSTKVFSKTNLAGLLSENVSWGDLFLFLFLLDFAFPFGDSLLLIVKPQR